MRYRPNDQQRVCLGWPLAGVGSYNSRPSAAVIHGSLSKGEIPMRLRHLAIAVSIPFVALSMPEPAAHASGQDKAEPVTKASPATPVFLAPADPD